MPTPPTSKLAVAGTGRLPAWASRAENQLLVLLGILAFFPLLFELGRNPVQLWDESRLAVNAATMALHGHWLVPYYGNEPDHWNTKPPLLIWLQALNFQLFGFSTWALRLPSALASVATVLLVFRFGARTLQRPLAGFFGGLVLVTCAGFIKIHVARTGDYDALLVLEQTIVWTCFFQYLETQQRRYLYWVAGALTMAMLTKSVAGLLGLPSLFLYALTQRKLGWLLRQPRLYVLAALGAAVMVGYYAAREAADPGYWQAVKYNDIAGRFLENQGDGDQWYYYLRNFKLYTFTPWLWAVVPAVVLSLVRTTGATRRAALLLLLFVGGWLLVVSVSVSRHDWYDAPMYPPLCLLLGLGLSILYQDLMGLYLPSLGCWPGRAVQAAVFLGVFFVPYQAIIEQLVHERHSDYHIGPDGYLGEYLTALTRTEPLLTDFTVLYQGNYNAVLAYYQLIYQSQDKQVAIVGAADLRGLRPGTVAVFCNPTYRTRLDSTFRVMPLHEEGDCQTVLLLPR